MDKTKNHKEEWQEEVRNFGDNDGPFMIDSEKGPLILIYPTDKVLKSKYPNQNSYPRDR